MGTGAGMNRYQHHSNNAVLGAPPGMSIDECNALPITRIQYTDGAHAVASYWQPSSFELELIARGRPIRLVILGTTHAPLMLGVDGDGEL